MKNFKMPALRETSACAFVLFLLLAKVRSFEHHARELASWDDADR
jgi:hypothetical protein